MSENTSTSTSFMRSDRTLTFVLPFTAISSSSSGFCIHMVKAAQR